jgi:two-component system response regulator RegA
MTDTTRLLIIDDDQVFCDILQRSLSRHNIDAYTCTQTDEALALLSKIDAQYAIVDLRIKNESGLQLIKPLLAINPTLKIIVLTGYASLATAVEAIKLGAMDYLSKPVDVKSIMQSMNLLEKAKEEVEIPEKTVSLKRLEWEQIQRVLKENDGNITNTAKHLGMYRRTLQRKLNKKPNKW